MILGVKSQPNALQKCLSRTPQLFTELRITRSFRRSGDLSHRLQVRALVHVRFLPNLRMRSRNCGSISSFMRGPEQQLDDKITDGPPDWRQVVGRSIRISWVEGDGNDQSVLGVDAPLEFLRPQDIREFRVRCASAQYDSFMPRETNIMPTISWILRKCRLCKFLVEVIQAPESCVLGWYNTMFCWRNLGLRCEQEWDCSRNARYITLTIRTSALGSFAVCFMRGSRACVNTNGLTWLDEI